MTLRYGNCLANAKDIDTVDFVCYTVDTALRLELSSHRGGFLMEVGQ